MSGMAKVTLKSSGALTFFFVSFAPAGINAEFQAGGDGRILRLPYLDTRISREPFRICAIWTIRANVCL